MCIVAIAIANLYKHRSATYASISLAHPAHWIGACTKGSLINGLVCLALCTHVNNYGYDVTYKYCIP